MKEPLSISRKGKIHNGGRQFDGDLMAESIGL